MDDTGGTSAERTGARQNPGFGSDVLLLVGTSSDWFAAALEAVLAAEGFRVLRASEADAILRMAAEEAPGMVIVDERLPSIGAAALSRALLSGPLAPHVPLLVHASNYSEGAEVTEALKAGAWGSIEDPVRPPELLAKLRRYLELGARLRDRFSDMDEGTGLLNLTGFVRLLPVLTSLAQRRGSPITCTVFGPTRVGAGTLLEEQRRQTARICTRYVRNSDLCGWLDEADLAVATFDTPQVGAVSLARRLTGMAEAAVGESESEPVLSAGIAELRLGPDARAAGGSGAPEEGAREGVPTTEQLKGLYTLAAAQAALRRVRSAGGGIGFAEVT